MKINKIGKDFDLYIENRRKDFDTVGQVENRLIFSTPARVTQ